jgi:predicted DCC family thiol-disulfide oxidoreductase YuxK
MDENVTNSDSIILFDGMCNLCSGVVQFVIKKDTKNIFQYASLQSDFGRKTLKEFGAETTDYKSFLLYHRGKIYNKSTAALMVAKLLGNGMQFLYILIYIPRFIRDLFYSIIARNRYIWFGKKKVCWMPESGKIIKQI